MISNIFMYAELLSNIRSVSLTVALPSVSDESTRVEVSADGSTVIAHHAVVSESLKLPRAIKTDGKITKLTLATRPSADLTFRLPLASSATSSQETGDNIAPWKASGLVDKSPCCRSCQTPVLRESNGSLDWRDLPSDDWAEMMDFWHCHKPHEKHTDHQEIGEQKGYGHSNRLQAMPGVGLVGLTTILISTEDCMVTKTSAPSSNATPSTAQSSPERLRCTSCNARVGIEDPLANGYKLDKWALAFSNSSDDAILANERHDNALGEWITVRLIAAIERTGLRKFIVAPEDGDAAKALELWIFSDDIRFASTALGARDAESTRAMKVFWKDAHADNSAAVLHDQSFSHERIDLPDEIFESFTDELRSSAELLPISARTFQTWQVGLLRRFDS